jgi:hypothetical protein
LEESEETTPTRREAARMSFMVEVTLDDRYYTLWRVV